MGWFTKKKKIKKDKVLEKSIQDLDSKIDEINFKLTLVLKQLNEK